MTSSSLVVDSKFDYDVHIVELTSGGHRITFLQYLIDFARSKELTVCIVTLPNTIASGSFDHLNVPQISLDVKHRFGFLPNNIVYGLIAQIEIYISVRKHLATVQPKLGVIFPTLQATGALPLGFAQKGFPCNWSGVVMAPAAHLRSFSIDSPHRKIELFMQKIAYRRIARQSRCLRVASFDHLFVSWMNSKKIVNSPDPVVLYSKYLSLGPEFKRFDFQSKAVIAVVGTIDKRKQIQLLSSVLNSMPKNSYHLLIAGKVKNKEQLEGKDVEELAKAGQLTIVPRRLSDEEVDYCFHIADVVWSGNTRTYGSSGAVVRGGAHAKPVITMHGSVMGSMLEAVEGGPVVDMSSEKDVMNSLMHLVSEQERQLYGKRNYEVFKDNSADRYAEIVFAPLLE